MKANAAFLVTIVVGASVLTSANGATLPPFDYWGVELGGTIRNNAVSLLFSHDVIYEGYEFALACTEKYKSNLTDVKWTYSPKFEASFNESRSDLEKFDFHGGHESSQISVTYNNSIYVVKYLYWQNISKEVSGKYFCNNREAFNLIVRPPRGNITGILSTGETVNAASEVVKYGGRIKLVCDIPGDYIADGKLIKWTFPPDKYLYGDEKQYYRVFSEGSFLYIAPLEEKLHHYRDQDTGKWVLEVLKVLFLNVGLYTCMYNQTIYSRYFLYAKANETAGNWVVLPPVGKRGADRVYRITAYFSQQNLTLGCGQVNPSKPVIVKGIVGGKQQEIITSYDDFSNNKSSAWTYNPFQGFQIKSIDSWNLERRYSCHSQRFLYYNFALNVIGVEVFAQHGQSTLNEFDKLFLTCKSKNFSPPNLKWRWTPHDSLSSGVKLKTKHVNDALLENWNCWPIVLKEIQDSASNNTFYLSQIICNQTPGEASGIFECVDLNDLNVLPGTYNLTVLRLKSVEGESKEMVTVPDPTKSFHLPSMNQSTQQTKINENSVTTGSSLAVNIAVSLVSVIVTTLLVVSLFFTCYRRVL